MDFQFWLDAVQYSVAGMDQKGNDVKKWSWGEYTIVIVLALTVMIVWLLLGLSPAPDGAAVDGVAFSSMFSFLLYRYGVIIAGLAALGGGAFVMMAARFTDERKRKEIERREDKEFVGLAGAIAGEVQVFTQTLVVCATRLHEIMVESPDDETVRRFIFEKLSGFAPKPIVYPSVADKIGHLGPGLANDVVIFYSLCSCLNFDNMKGARRPQFAARGRALAGALSIGARLQAKLHHFAETYHSDVRRIDGDAIVEEYEVLASQYGDDPEGNVDPEIWPQFVKENDPAEDE